MSEPKSPENKPAQPAGPTLSKMEKLVALCRRRGFIWQSSEIYGGINGFWDYGPLGVELKRNLKDAWWRDIVRCPGVGANGKILDMVGLDCTIIMNPKVWVASGHVGGFADAMVADREEHGYRGRADKVWNIGFFSNAQRNSAAWQQVAAHSTTIEQLLSSQTEISRIIAEVPGAFVPDVVVAIEADGEILAAASAYAALTKRQRQHLGWPEEAERAVHGKPWERGPISWLHILKNGFWEAWTPLNNTKSRPLISPATQKPTLTEPRQFNLMFESHAGPVQDEANKVYLRPETAQGIFCNFRNVVDTSRVKVPFGIAQVGKAFRNEVTPRNFTFRSREFEQMEIEFFIHPSTAHEWYKFWRDSRFVWWQSIGLTSSHLQLREHDKDELAHYAKEGAGTSDIEYKFPFTDPGFGELEGVAHRTDFDLRQHAQHSGLGDKLKYFDQEKNERYFPHVIEPSAGADRGTLALLCEAYTDDPARPSGVVMKFHPRMAPIKAGVFPLVNKEGMPEVAEKLYMELRQHFMIEYDAKQAIGRRYARMDEAGTPYCFTIDGDTLKDQTVTVRHRDTLQQERINISQVLAFLKERIV